ncbi:MAG TPA: insulinase family protein, partial [Polyangiaceae bacterium]|nr:insulinase family protein [Polyangiaceae bacterium]
SYHTWYRVGSRYEQPGKTGLAHFFEHMMFNETKHLAYGEFDARMEAAGAETNAATWIDWTYYYESLPSEELPLAIELEADRMANLVVRKKQVESEREVVLNERRMAVEDDVRGAADELLHSMAFGRTHPHGWPTIGWMEDIEGYRVSDCRAFYKTWYAPNNATVIIVGDFDRDETLGRLRKAYGRQRASDLPKTPKPRRRRRRGGGRTIPWPTPSEKLLVAWHAPAEGHPDQAVVEVIHDLLLGGRSARLRRKLVEEQQVASRLRGSVGGLQHGGLFDIWVDMRPGFGADLALQEIERELRRLAEQRVSAPELNKVKARAELFALSAVETMGEKAYQVGYGETVVGDPAHLFVRLEQLARVTSKDVQRIARGMFREDRRSMVRVASPETLEREASR